MNCCVIGSFFCLLFCLSLFPAGRGIHHFRLSIWRRNALHVFVVNSKSPRSAFETYHRQGVFSLIVVPDTTHGRNTLELPNTLQLVAVERSFANRGSWSKFCLFARLTLRFLLCLLESHLLSISSAMFYQIPLCDSCRIIQTRSFRPAIASCTSVCWVSCF
jgi:hypothetical protein